MVLFKVVEVPALGGPIIVEPEAETRLELGRGVSDASECGVELLGLAISVRRLMAVDETRPFLNRGGHTFDERHEQAVFRFARLDFPLRRFLSDVTRTEGDQDGEPGHAFLERGHDFAAAKSGLLGVVVEGFRLGVALLGEVEQLALVLFGIEKHAAATAVVREGSGQLEIRENGRMVVEPVKIGGRGVDPEEILVEVTEPRRLQIVSSLA